MKHELLGSFFSNMAMFIFYSYKRQRSEKIILLLSHCRKNRKKQSKQLNQKTQICKRCFKEIKDATFHNLLHSDVSLCHKCLSELKPVFNEFKIGDIKCLNIYWYTDTIQGLLYQFKGCTDYELKDTFLDYYNEYISLKYHGYIMIPAPSSEEANKERGFNQVVEMFSKVKLPMYCCIHKRNDFKQHSLNSKERSEVKNLLKIDNIDLSKKKILIVDDVYTTGATVKSMIELIKKKNPHKIQVLVMAKTIDLDLR